mgnify:CR=1 FL=1
MGKLDEVLALSKGPEEGYDIVQYNSDEEIDPNHGSQSRRQTQGMHAEWKRPITMPHFSLKGHVEILSSTKLMVKRLA